MTSQMTRSGAEYRRAAGGLCRCWSGRRQARTTASSESTSLERAATRTSATHTTTW